MYTHLYQLFDEEVRYMMFSMKCTCGDVMTIEAADKGEAVFKMKEMMNEEAIQNHMSDKHPDQPVMSVDQMHVMIDQALVEGTMG